MTGALLGAHRFVERELPVKLRSEGGRLLLLTDVALYVVETNGTLTSVVEGVGGHDLAHDGQGWAVRHRDREAIVLAPRIGAPPVCYRPTRYPAGIHVFDGRLVTGDGEFTAILPLEDIARQAPSVHARVIETELEQVALEAATVIDNPHNMLRLQTSSRPLVEVRSGPLGLARGDDIQVGFDQGSVAVLVYTEEGTTRRLVAREGAFKEATDDRIVGTSSAFSPPPPHETPRVLEVLRRHGVASTKPLERSAETTLAEMLRDCDNTRDALAAVLREVVVYGPGPGPNACVFSYSWDDIGELGADLTSAIGSSRVAFETRPRDGALSLSVTLDGQRVESVIRNRGGGAISGPITEALDRAGIEQILVDVHTDDEEHMFMLAPRRVIDALVAEGVEGLVMGAAHSSRGGAVPSTSS